MRTPVVAGNWKLNGTRAGAAALAQSIAAAAPAFAPRVQVVLCPTFVHLVDVAAQLQGSGVALGAQDAADQVAGAFTGEVAAPMLAECGCEYVIVGHSERRQLYGDSDERAARKFAAVSAAGLTPVFCVGETLREREADATEAVIACQLDAVVDLLGADSFDRAVIAYEPVWAIGTGHTASPEQAQAVHAFIRARLSAPAAVRILYGGSVKPDNAARLFAMEDIDGGLIGGASLQATDFIAICEAALPSG